jgi:hypothetical protein
MNDDEQPAADAPAPNPPPDVSPEPADDGQPVDPGVEPNLGAPHVESPGPVGGPDETAVTAPVPVVAGADAAGATGEFGGAGWQPDPHGSNGGSEVDVATPKRRGLQIALGAVGVAALGGAIWFGVSQMTTDSPAGADTPEEAVEAVFEAIEERDVVGLLEAVDPGERETIGQGARDVLDELVRLEVLDEPATEPGVPGFTIEFDDLVLSSETVDEDIANVSVTGGTVDTTLDPSELPIGELLAEQGVDTDGQEPVTNPDQPIDLEDVVITTVERDGGWYVSLWYSIAENARLDAGLPMPDAAGVPEPVGAESPGEAVQAMIDALTALDVPTMIGMLDPVEASALYRYSPLFLDDAEAAVAEIPEYELQIGGLEFPTEEDGDRAVVQVEPGDEVTLDVSVPSEDVDLSAVFADGGMTLQMTAEGEDVEITTEDFECFEFTAAGETETVCSSDLEDNEQFGAQLDALRQFEWPFAPEVMDRFASAYGDAGLGTVERDGRWYLSPTHTLFDLALRGVRELDSDDVRTLLGEAQAFDAEQFLESIDPAISGLQDLEDGTLPGTPGDEPVDPDTTDGPSTEEPVTDLEFELNWLALTAGRDLTDGEKACLTPLVEERLAAGDYYYDAEALLGECGIVPSVST